MAYRKTSYNLIDHILDSDIYSDLGVLLLSAGTRLKAQDITQLLEVGILEIEIEEIISNKISTQMEGLWLKSDYKLSESYFDNLERTKKLFQLAVEGKAPPIKEFLKAYIPLLEMNLKQSYLFLQLNKIKGHDEYTYRHSLNVGLLASLIGKIQGFSREDCILLGEMGLFHDIGKMRIPNQILQKPGKLTKEEFEEIKNHTKYGYEILRGMDGSNELIEFGALLHHEKLDGSGYPQGLKDEQIPLFVQILTVADTYDAICSDRVYRQKNSTYFAGLELMQETYKGKLNPKIVISFVNYIVEGLVGSKAVLSNGKSGEVMLIHAEEPHRPLIRVGEMYLDLRRYRDIDIVEVITE